MHRENLIALLTNGVGVMGGWLVKRMPRNIGMTGRTAVVPGETCHLPPWGLLGGLDSREVVPFRISWAC